MNLTYPAGVAEPKSSANAARREAVGAEIPVTVHASRSNQALGKNLPSVHEDTRTVIVLQQGAVVRMTAGLSAGETVVLTNRMTGADVLCRVGNIKSQPGMQHYVDLEFIQRAPGFWGDTVAASSAPLAADAPAAVPAPAPAPAIVSNPVAVLPAPPAPVAAPPPTMVAAGENHPTAPVLAPPSKSLPTPAAALPIPESAPDADLAPIPPPARLETAPLAEPAAPARKTAHAAPPIATTAPSFAGVQPEVYSRNSSGSKKVLLGAAAALLLVLAGAGGGYWFLSRQSNAASSPSVLQASVPSPLQPAPDLTTIGAPAMEPEPSAALSAAASEPRMDVVIESRLVEAPVPARLQPEPVAAARTPAPPPARRPVVPIGQLKAPKAKTAVPRTDAGDPMPMMLGATNLSDTAAAGTLLSAGAVAPSPPPASAQPAAGGQLQQPQLLSSTAPAYPATARSLRIQGTVVLDALVDETGKVLETKVIAGPAPLLLAAQDAVRAWKYKPAQLNGKPIAVHARVSVRFSLR